MRGVRSLTPLPKLMFGQRPVGVSPPAAAVLRTRLRTYGAWLVMAAAALRMLCSCSATGSNPCPELNGGSLNRSRCEALLAGFTSVDCCGAALDPYTPLPRPIATTTRSCVCSIGPGGTHGFWLPYVLSVAILLQAWPLTTRPCAAWGPFPHEEHAFHCFVPSSRRRSAEGGLGAHPTLASARIGHALPSNAPNAPRPLQRLADSGSGYFLP